jgi:hemerythrin
MTEGSKPAATGVRSIDVGHECLMFLVDRFYHPSVICHGADGPACRRIEETLLFMRRQLDREEHLMRLSGYADLPDHVRDHREIIARLKALHRDLECSRYDNHAVGALIRDWCRGHVERHDRPLGAYLESCGLSLSEEGRS